MDFAANKLDDFTNKIIDLYDQPNMQPDELKAYFDSSPEEVRQAHNGLCDALGTADAASGIGFQTTAGVPADNVQDAIEDVQAQLTDAVLGNIPSGSVDGDKLAQDVRNRFTAIETAAATEVTNRTSGDNNLQSQINTHTSQISSLSTTKCELYTGTYVGNGAATQNINLGFQPKAVLVMYMGFLLSFDDHLGYNISQGGIAIQNWSNTGIAITSSGFQVRQNTNINYETGMNSTRVNSTGATYVYLAFK